MGPSLVDARSRVVLCVFCASVFGCGTGTIGGYDRLHTNSASEGGYVETGDAVTFECGNGACEEDEDCSACPADCGVCPARCGDDVCDAGEDCWSCSLDCGACGEPDEECEPTDGTTCIDNPYKGYANWCKVAVHIHPWEVSSTSVEAMENAYRDHGYDLIFLTEHDHVMNGEFPTPSPNPGLVVAMGEEVSAPEGHCNALGISSIIPRGTAWQEVIDMTAAQGGLVQVNHPSRYGHTPEDLDALDGLWALEVKNEGQNAPSDIVLWDSQISQGKKLWGTFSDDAHIVEVVGWGWLMVNTPADCSEDAVIANMRIGNFYDSEGPELDVWVNGMTINVSSDTGVRIDWYAENMTVVQTTDASSDSYTVDGSEVFVRAVVTDGSDQEALTMPLFVRTGG